ncbi:hypothetical protein [Clostridium minihomine]|uniref:hypothetical protein n=1 Tax=Clostridium minihomine TaxID=2045012 RepID=UPI000C7572A3|nr:hypothetical protein [Clostridium minihomine]
MINNIAFKSKKILKENQKIYDSITSIKNTRKSIDEYYSQEISSDSLIKMLNQLEFYKTQDYSFISTMVTGIFTGALSSMIFSLSDFERSNLIIVNIILFLIVIIFCCVIAGITAWLVYVNLKKLYVNSNYLLYVIPYECNTIRQKLEKTYQIELSHKQLPINLK